MANFGISRRRQQNLEVRKAIPPSLSCRERRAVFLALLVGGRLLVLWSIMFGEVAKGNIEEYLGYARIKGVYFMHRYVTIAYILMIEETHSICVEYSFAGRFWSFRQNFSYFLYRNAEALSSPGSGPPAIGSSTLHRQGSRAPRNLGGLARARAHRTRACRVQKFLSL